MADLLLRRFLQSALPGGTAIAMQAHLVGLLPSPTCHSQSKSFAREEVENEDDNFIF